MERFRVSESDIKKIRLNETDAAKSVRQNIAIILNTWRGSVPLYREFGISPKFLNRPVPVVKSMLLADVQEAIEHFESRVSVVGITFDEDKENPGRLIPIVEVEINE